MDAGTPQSIDCAAPSARGGAADPRTRRRRLRAVAAVATVLIVAASALIASGPIARSQAQLAPCGDGNALRTSTAAQGREVTTAFRVVCLYPDESLADVVIEWG